MNPKKGVWLIYIYGDYSSTRHIWLIYLNGDYSSCIGFCAPNFRVLLVPKVRLSQSVVLA